jgi:hypothetical protein
MHVAVVDPSRTVLKAVSRLLAKEGHKVSALVAGRPVAKTDAACVSNVLRSASRPKHDDQSTPLNESTASGRVTCLLDAQPGGQHVDSADKRN